MLLVLKNILHRLNLQPIPWKLIRETLRLIWVVIGFGFFAWLIISFQAKGVDEEILKSNERVLVQKYGNLISFSPLHSEYHTALIFYPGAMVDPIAYAPLARKIAQEGFRIIIIKLPFRLAPSKTWEFYLFWERMM